LQGYQACHLGALWRLAAFGMNNIKNRFRLADTSRTGTIELGDKGKAEINFINQL